MRARLGGVELAPQTYTTSGNFTYQRDLPAVKALPREGVVDVVFSVDEAIMPNNGDPRELGLIVRGAAIR